jgi:Polysaccharide lyase
MLALLLTAVALVSIQPWAPNRVGPRLEVPDLLGKAGVGEATAVAHSPAPQDDGLHVGAGTATPVVKPIDIPEVGSPAHVGLGVGVGVPVAGLAPVRHQPSEQAPDAPAPVAAPPPSAAPAPAPVAAPQPSPQLVADFEAGLDGFSTDGAGNVPPRVASGIARDGERAVVIRLTGDQSNSRLIVGGDGGGGEEDVVQIREGQEIAVAFSFYIQTMIYGEPGADNLVLRFLSDASEALTFGLELWDPAGAGTERGLWSSGEAVGGDRFLAPVTERSWHDAVVHFKASSQGAGFYAVYLDGELVDAREGVSLIAPGSEFAQLEVGLFRDGERVQGTSEIRLDAAKLGDTLESVLP